MCYVFFFFNDTATTEIYTLSLHDALPICRAGPLHRRAGTQRLGHEEAGGGAGAEDRDPVHVPRHRHLRGAAGDRSEEHTSELQSQSNLVCRLLLEKKKKLSPQHARSSSLV